MHYLIFFFISALAVVFFFLSLLEIDVRTRMAFIIPTLAVGLNLVAMLGAVQIEFPQYYLYNINETVFFHKETDLVVSFPAALMFMLFAILGVVKLLMNMVAAIRIMKQEKELELEGWV